MTNKRERLGELTARMSCPPHGMPEEGCVFGEHDSLTDTCVECWLRYAEPEYARQIEEGQSLNVIDSAKAILITQDEKD